MKQFFSRFFCWKSQLPSFSDKYLEHIWCRIHKCKLPKRTWTHYIYLASFLFLQFFLVMLTAQKSRTVFIQVKEFDSISRLDQWLTTMLLRIKKTIQGDEGDLKWSGQWGDHPLHGTLLPPLPFHISFVQWPSPGFPKQYVKMYCCDISREYTYKPVLLNWYPVIYYSIYQKFSTPVQRSAPVSLLRITRLFLETRSEPIQEREIQGYNGDLR